MTHIYKIDQERAIRKANRAQAVSDIRFLRKYEGSAMIDALISRHMEKLHASWFRK